MYFSHHPMSRRSRSMVARAYCRATGSTRVSVEPGLALTFDRTTWAPIIQGLGTDVRTVAIDLPGHGETGGSPSSLWLSILSMGRCRPRALRARRFRHRGAGVQVEEWPDSGHCVHLVELDRFASRLRAFINSLHTGSRANPLRQESRPRSAGCAGAQVVPGRPTQP